MSVTDEHKQIVCGAIARTYNTLKPGEWVTDDAVIERTAAEVIARLTAALAAAPPVADAEVERLAGHLKRIAEASRRDDGTDIPLGEQCREAAALIRSLHARAVRAEAERDALKTDLATKAATYFRAEIGRLMHQAEHWSHPAHEHPFAVHHRMHKAEAYYQVVHLFRRSDAWEVIGKPDTGPAGAYPWSQAMHDRYWEAHSVAVLPPMPVQTPRCAPMKDLKRAEAERDDARALLAEAKEALAEAADAIESWGSFANDYAREKHDLDGDVSRARDVLARLEGAAGNPVTEQDQGDR